MHRITHMLFALVMVVGLMPGLVRGDTTNSFVLRAPYRGPITPLRDACMDIPYGDIVNIQLPGLLRIAGTQIDIWADTAGDGAEWDPSILLLHHRADGAANTAIDLSGCTDEDSAYPFGHFDDYRHERAILSFRAVGTKLLSPVKFVIKFHYYQWPGNSRSSGQCADVCEFTTGDIPEIDQYCSHCGPAEVTQTFEVTVLPLADAFGALQGDRHMYHHGAEAFGVSVANLSLSVPIGRTAFQIGVPGFYYSETGPEGQRIPRVSLLLPGEAAPFYVPDSRQFDFGSGQYWGMFLKPAHGSPCSGHRIGWHFEMNNSSASRWVEIYSPDGWVYETRKAPGEEGFDDLLKGDGFYRIESMYPVGGTSSDPAAIKFTYDSLGRLTSMYNQATTQASINLDWSQGQDDRVVITTSVDPTNRKWTVFYDGSNRITEVRHQSKIGSRKYTWGNGTTAPADRVVKVEAAADAAETTWNTLYEFEYFPSAHERAGDLYRVKQAEDDGTLQTIVEHEWNGANATRKEYVAAGEYRQYDLAYGHEGELPHMLSSLTEYAEPGGSGVACTTQFFFDFHPECKPTPDGSGTCPGLQDGDNMALGRLMTVALPDGSRIVHTYDAAEERTDGGSSPFRRLGLRTKTRIAKGAEELTTYDVQYDYLYEKDSKTCLYYMPRIVSSKDGRGNERRFIYETGGQDDNGDGINGEISNQLFTATGPTITQGISGERTPETTYSYYTSGLHRGLLESVTVKVDSENNRVTTHVYDDLRRIIETHQDPLPAGLDLVTEYVYADDQATQDVIVRDPHDYVTRTRHDPDGRVMEVLQYIAQESGARTGLLTALSGKAASKTAYTYEPAGWLKTVAVDNRDSDGNALTPATVTTTHTNNRRGWLLDASTPITGKDPNESHIRYNWLGDVIRDYDTSGRGTATYYDGRGLTTHEVPLKLDAVEDPNLTTSYERDSLGRLTMTSVPSGVRVEKQYDGVGRVKAEIRHPIPGVTIPAPPPGGVASGSQTGDMLSTTKISTVYEYDEDSNVIRTTVREGDPQSTTVVSNATANYDEGGFKYQDVQRYDIAATADAAIHANDRVRQWGYNAVGEVVVEKKLGDSTVAPDNSGSTDSVTSTLYDKVGRVTEVTEGDSIVEYKYEAGADTNDNVVKRISTLGQGRLATTTTTYDAFGRTVRIVDSVDTARVTAYTTLGVPLWNATLDANGTPLSATAFVHNEVGTMIQRAELADPTQVTTGTITVNRQVDTVIDYDCDPDGRVDTITQYNNDSAAPLVTQKDRDDWGRVIKATGPSGGFTESQFDPDTGLLVKSFRAADGVDANKVETAHGYDGHGRLYEDTTKAGSETTTTRKWFDALGRVTTSTDARGVVTTTERLDAVGNQVKVTVDPRTESTDPETGETESVGIDVVTTFTYNRLSHLIQQRVQNKDSKGNNTTEQITTYRSDTQGRSVRTVFPDADAFQHEDPMNATKCVALTYDEADRVATQTDQNGVTTAYTYYDDGLVHTKAVGNTVETFTYYPDKALETCQRGTVADPDADSYVRRTYDSNGQILTEEQHVSGVSLGTVVYTYDQAGRMDSITYPSSAEYGEFGLELTPTPFGATDQIDLTLSGTTHAAFVKYNYDGRRLRNRVSRTVGLATTNYFETAWDYDDLNRITSVRNSLHSGTHPMPPGTEDELAGFAFTLDDAGAPLTRTVTGRPAFAGDSQILTVDRTGRLTAVDHDRTQTKESTALDGVGNRESHTTRNGETTEHATATAANQITSITREDQQFDISYDNRGNLSVDEDDRQYIYDEKSQLIQILGPAPDNTLLASFKYDALGRRIEKNIDGTITRYFHDGDRVIEEYDGATDDLLCRHINGSQYIDERIATQDAQSVFHYCLLDRNFSVVGTISQSGSLTKYDYGPTGFGTGAAFNSPDFDADSDVDATDFQHIQGCSANGPDLEPPADDGVSPTPRACDDADLDNDSDVDAADLAIFQGCMSGSGVAAADECLEISYVPVVRYSVFTLHGRPVDILPDGKAFIYVRARYYDPEHGRWLQRDPLGYIDGPNLYEAFGNNPTANVDPTGLEDTPNLRFDPDGGLSYSDYGTAGMLWWRQTSWNYFDGSIGYRLGGSDLYLVDKQDWPWLFIMTQDQAKTILDKGGFQNQWDVLAAIVTEVTKSSVTASEKIVYYRDKTKKGGEWLTGIELCNDQDKKQALIDNLRTGVKLKDLNYVAQVTEISYQMSMGLLALPGGLAAEVIEDTGLAIDTLSGRISPQQALTAVAVAAGGYAASKLLAVPSSGRRRVARANEGAAPSGGGARTQAAEEAITSSIGDLRRSGEKDAHHVIQDAAVRDLPSYNTSKAPGVRLDGPSNVRGTPHSATRSVQRQAGGGTFAAERRIAYKALRRAGFTPQEARRAIREADRYFESIGVGPNTPTRIPGDRR